MVQVKITGEKSDSLSQQDISLVLDIAREAYPLHKVEELEVRETQIKGEVRVIFEPHAKGKDLIRRKFLLCLPNTPIGLGRLQRLGYVIKGNIAADAGTIKKADLVEVLRPHPPTEQNSPYCAEGRRFIVVTGIGDGTILDLFDMLQPGRQLQVTNESNPMGHQVVTVDHKEQIGLMHVTAKNQIEVETNNGLYHGITYTFKYKGGHWILVLVSVRVS